jgi:hypothetical protein
MAEAFGMRVSLLPRILGFELQQYAYPHLDSVRQVLAGLRKAEHKFPRFWARYAFGDESQVLGPLAVIHNLVGIGIHLGSLG